MPVKIDKISPKLIASTPKAGGSAINSHQDITLFFDESVKSGTGSIVISNGKDIHKIAITDAQVKISNKTITINPIADLLPNSHYTVTVSATAIQDVVGNKFAGKSFTFDTFDTIAPVLKTTNPTNGSKLVSVNRDISFTFNEKIKLGDGNIILSNGSDVLKISVNDPQVSVSGTKLRFNPIHDFVSGSSYTVKLETNAVKDLAGNVFTGNGDGFKFYTKPEVIVDKTAPLLTQTTPNDNVTSVLVNTDLKLVFNETIRAGAGDIVISNGKDIRTISIADKSQVTINGNTVNINPKADLLAGGNYNVQLSTGVILDKAGNTFAGISNATTFDFTTKAAVVPVLTTGKAIDGYLSGSDVFADENGDGIQNEGEASAKTDKSGNFTLTNAKGTLHISGGIDLSTGKAFKGALKAPEGSSVVTPFTTVQQGFIDAGQTPAQAQKSVATAFGFDTSKVDLTKYDPISELVNASITGKTDPVAVQMMANTAKIANFLVTASEILQGAAGVDASSKTNNLSIQSASNALINALVTAAENKAKTSDSKIDLADSALLKTVLITSSENSHADKNFTPIESADYQSKISKMADTVSFVLKDSADNINNAVNTGGNALTLLTNMAKVTAFTQGNIGSSLKTFAETFDPNSATATSTLKAQEIALTGTVADTSAANIVVTPFSGVSTNFIPPVAPPTTVTPPVTVPIVPPTTVTPPVTVPIVPPTTITPPVTVPVTPPITNNTPPPITPPTTTTVTPPFDNSGSSSTTTSQAPVAPKSILTYTPSTLVETSANDGSVATTVTLSLMTLTGDAFKGTNGQALTGAVVTNVPTGLTATVTKVNNTTATLTLTGKAVAHGNSDDVSNLTVTLGNTSFIGGNSNNVIGATKPNLSIDFKESPTIAYSTTTFAEAAVNDGSIATTATLTLTGDTFKGTIGQAVTGAAITNVPIGLTASLIKATDTTATL
ncbi:MAG: Ig-like domain-containing protein, partial [Methylococcaceae bacterium]